MPPKKKIVPLNKSAMKSISKQLGKQISNAKKRARRGRTIKARIGIDFMNRETKDIYSFLICHTGSDYIIMSSGYLFEENYEEGVVPVAPDEQIEKIVEWMDDDNYKLVTFDSASKQITDRDEADISEKDLRFFVRKVKQAIIEKLDDEPDEDTP